jgi:hypothetical protein
LASSVAEARQAHAARAHLYLGEEELRAEEVARRLVRDDALSGRASTRLAINPLMGEQFLDLVQSAKAEDTTPADVLTRLEQRGRHHPDPLHIVGLDRAAGSAWFSDSELVALKETPSRWEDILRAAGRIAGCLPPPCPPRSHSGVAGSPSRRGVTTTA